MADPSPTPPSLSDRHLLIGWWGLFVFATGGVALEAMHGFKIGWYLDADEETRRLLLRLAHAHGTVLSLVHLGFASTLRTRPDLRGTGFASVAMTAALVAMPGGFLLGGLMHLGGDPGVGILAVPIGAILLLAGLATTALGVGRPRS